MRTTQGAPGRVAASQTAVEKLTEVRRHQFSLSQEISRNWQGWLGSMLLHAGICALALALTASVVAVPAKAEIKIPIDPLPAAQTPMDLIHDDLPDFNRTQLVDSDKEGPPSVEGEALFQRFPGYHPGEEYGAVDAISSGGRLLPTTHGQGDGWSDGLSGKSFGDQVTIFKQRGLEVVFCFDSTGSMGGIIQECKSRIRTLIKVVTYLVPNARIGVVTYRDWKKYDLDDYEYLVKYLPLQTCDKDGIDKIQRFLRETEAYGGGDIPEAVQAGLATAVDKMGWNPRAMKIVIVFGDAPPHPEDNGLSTTLDLCKRFKTMRGVVSAIDTTGESKLMDEFRQMAAAGGGEATFLNDERAIIKQLTVMIFGSKWTKEIDNVYKAVAADRDTIVGD